MKPFRDYDLGKVISNQRYAMSKKIDSMTNEEILSNDLEILADNFYEEFYIQPVEIYEEVFSKRSVVSQKIKKYIHPSMRDIYEQEYIEVDGVVATFFFEYHGDADLFKCRASTFSLSGYPEITVSQDTISFRIEKSLSEMQSENAKDALLNGIQRDLHSIREGMSYVNNDVNKFNASLREDALSKLKEKREKVEAFYQIAKMFEVQIEKKAYAKNHIPLTRNIVPIAHNYNREDYYCVNDSDYSDILATIKHTASTYESTPSSYKSMQEEDLRNTLLAALNATYRGIATGEAFRNSGKTDIKIEYENRAAFIAECKMWAGKSEIEQAIMQLDGYLTWRDCKTALIYFVRRKDFFRILDIIPSALNEVSNMRNVKKIDKNEFDCLYLSKSNPGQQVHMRVMLFNLYCASN